MSAASGGCSRKEILTADDRVGIDHDPVIGQFQLFRLVLPENPRGSGVSDFVSVPFRIEWTKVRIARVDGVLDELDVLGAEGSSRVRSRERLRFRDRGDDVEALSIAETFLHIGALLLEKLNSFVGTN